MTTGAKILLAFPRARANYGSGDLKREDLKLSDASGISPPIGLLYVASLLRQAGYTPSLLDLSVGRCSEGRLRRALKDVSAVGIYTQTHFVPETVALISAIRDLRGDIRIFTGGPDCTCYGRLYAGADLSFVGEVDATLAPAVKELLADNTDYRNMPGVVYRDRSCGTVVCTHQPPPLQDLDCVPFPDRTIVERDRYSLFGAFRGQTTAVTTSRGCNGACRFCERRFYSYGQRRERSIQSVLTELQDIRDQGYRFVHVNDDDFLANEPRSRRLLDAITRRKLGLYFKILTRVDHIDEEMCEKLRAAGVRFVDLGIESASQRTLDFYGKRTSVDQARVAVLLLDQYGIYVHGHVMFGAPFETEGDLDRAMQFVCDLPVDTMFLNILGYRRHSNLWREAVEASLIEEDEYTVLATRARGLSRFSREQLTVLHERGIRTFYFRWRYLLRQLRKLFVRRDMRFVGAMVVVWLNILRSLAGSCSARGLWAMLGRKVARDRPNP